MIEKSIEKQDAVLDTVNEINKSFGDGAIQWLGSNKMAEVKTISTGCVSLDIALGGGIPKNRIIEIFGTESAGKTTLASHIISEFQKEKILTAFVDAEHAFDPEYAKKIGVDIDKLLFSQPSSGEQALQIVEKLITSGKVGLIVIDSVAALTPQAEIDGVMGQSHMGLQARLMSQALRKLVGLTTKYQCTIIFLNQIRMKIGISFGDPSTTTGGNGLKYYASVRIRLSKQKADLDKDKVAVGDPVTAKIVKNKVAPPFRKACFQVRYNMGIDKVGDIVALALEKEIISKAGAFYTVDGHKSHGLEDLRNYVEKSPNVLKVLKAQILK
jgi:recombination protein RecA